MADLNAPSASLEVRGLSFGYSAAQESRRLEDISFSVGAGEICCLLGPNGAGKTTLLRCLLHHLTPASGSVSICGQAAGRLSARALARLVAYVPQTASTPFAFTALDIAVMGRTPYLRFSTTPGAADRRLALGCLDDLGVSHLQDRIFTSLSGGEKQLVLLARALVQQAPVLILDEPTAALDYGHEVRLLQRIAGLAQTGRTILMTTHQPAHALWYGTTAVLMHEGRLIAKGAPGTTITSDSLTALYGADIRVATLALPDWPTALRTCLPLPAPGVRGPASPKRDAGYDSLTQPAS